MSPELSQLIINCLLQCSGNGRAIEYLYFNYGDTIRDTINKYMNGDDIQSNISQITNTVNDFLQNYAKEYPNNCFPLVTEKQKQYSELVSLMGITKSPDSPLFPLHICQDMISIEKYQWFGRFVSISIENNQRTYVGSFVLTKALDKDIIVQELNPLDGIQNDDDICTNIQIRLQWLVTPFTIFGASKKQRDHFKTLQLLVLFGQDTILHVLN